MKFFKNYIFLDYLNIILCQLVPYEEPLSKYNKSKLYVMAVFEFSKSLSKFF